ncbi:acetylglutamate kinase [Polluticaenibacter yanchengensis]|uniref:Acetylglutamate kinase n=1 Tax=Polluticaenibacter yanchengensis TaxID=3014562 RepID=A0ABT4UMT2_9BACT|nr:acetylglutamate kinase [Chitinophagaceae bacterium LY-5]
MQIEKLVVIKIGGNIVDDKNALSDFLSTFATLAKSREDTALILVHGGGKIATKIGNQLGIESKYVDGRRITDDATIDLVTMVYGGLANKQIVAQLQANGCNALGLTGADANIMLANKRPVKSDANGNPLDYGWVGDVQQKGVNSEILYTLIQAGITPVLAPLTHDGKGHILNTNADTIAQETAKALSEKFEVHLIYSFEKPGVLLDAEDDSTVIDILQPAYYASLKAEQKIFAGMIPKLDNAFAALNNGVAKVIIGKAEKLPLLLSGESGTSIIL